jgi:transposase-like protein
MTKKIDAEILDELLKGCDRPEALLGEGGLMRDLKRALIQRMLEAELTEHLGYEQGEVPPPVQPNRRNGSSRKTVKGESGAFEIDVPRDREGSFEPRLIAKGQTRIDGLDEKIIAMYARGMSVRDIRSHLEELYGIAVSPDLISRVTDAVLDEVKEWRSRAGCRLPGGDLRRAWGEDPGQGQPDRQKQGGLSGARHRRRHPRGSGALDRRE